ncbi:hypothetical protein JB92DRAFT_3094924 [Gautieria morchelliformis]|nr:hypothetical protein JB92DRAFT_3094924 [Gautieria morchelliformis]
MRSPIDYLDDCVGAESTSRLVCAASTACSAMAQVRKQSTVSLIAGLHWSTRLQSVAMMVKLIRAVQEDQGRRSGCSRAQSPPWWTKVPFWKIARPRERRPEAAEGTSSDIESTCRLKEGVF